MKKLPMIILLIYLAISFVVFYSPKDEPKTSIDVWNGVKSALIKDTKNGKEKELQNVSTMAKEQREDALQRYRM